MDYQLVAYDEGRFETSPSINNFKSNENHSIEVRIKPTLRYRDNIPFVGTTLLISIGQEKRPLLTYIFTLTYWVEGFEKFITTSSSYHEIIEYTKDIWTDAIGFARGALAAKCIGTPFTRLFLPKVKMSKFLQQITLHKESNS